MEISKLKVVWKALTGGVSGVVEYLLDLLNNALDNLSDGNKETVEKVLNLALKVLSVLKVCGCFIPTKWQVAYADTVEAVETVCNSLEDLSLTKEEADKIADAFAKAVADWKAD